MISEELEQPVDDDTRRLERAIVMQLLRDDCPERWLAVDLASEIPDYALAMLERALVRLEYAGIVCRAGESVSASRAARHLDELDLIGI